MTTQEKTVTRWRANTLIILMVGLIVGFLLVGNGIAINRAIEALTRIFG